MNAISKILLQQRVFLPLHVSTVVKSRRLTPHFSVWADRTIRYSHLNRLFAAKGKCCWGAFYNNQTFLSGSDMPPPAKPNSPCTASSPSSTKTRLAQWAIRLTLWLLGLATGGIVPGTGHRCTGMAYPNLPDIWIWRLPAKAAFCGSIRRKAPCSASLGGAPQPDPHRGNPQVMKDAVVWPLKTPASFSMAAWITRHAAGGPRKPGKDEKPGASTITMQVARNVYLSSEKRLQENFTKYY